MIWNRGALALWLHQPKGGYGYIYTVPCVVMGETDKRVRIAVRKAGSGEVVYRSVTPGQLVGIQSPVNREIAESIREEAMGNNARRKLKLVRDPGKEMEIIADAAAMLGGGEMRSLP